MAIQANVKQSSLECLIYPIDWTLALLSGVTVTGVTITHTPPSGSAASFGDDIATPITYIESPKGLVTGNHYVSIVATTSNAALCPEVYLIIAVDR